MTPNEVRRIERMAYNPTDIGEFNMRYANRAAYHKLLANESGFIFRMYHKAAAAINRQLHEFNNVPPERWL